MDTQEIIKRLDTIQDELSRMHLTIKEHNGRLKGVEIWRAQVQGATSATKMIWGFLSVFVVAAVFAMFSVYSTVTNLEDKVTLQIIKEIETRGLIIE